jgi:hypothetical protein
MSLPPLNGDWYVLQVGSVDGKASPFITAPHKRKTRFQKPMSTVRVRIAALQDEKLVWASAVNPELLIPALVTISF